MRAIQRDDGLWSRECTKCKKVFVEPSIDAFCKHFQTDMHKPNGLYGMCKSCSKLKKRPKKAAVTHQSACC